jgi:hypothetical protein
MVKQQDADKQSAMSILKNTKDLAEVSVTSLSGGRSSSYMAIHYPTDYYVFAIVLTKDKNCRIQDKGLLRDIINKCPHFEGSRELDQTLINILRLEQYLGKEINWVWGEDFDSLIDRKKALPNKTTRFCTVEMKIKPVFFWCYNNVLNPVTDSQGNLTVTPIQMNIGFRADESRRVYRSLADWDKINKKWDWSNAGGCEPLDISIKCDIKGKYRNKHRIVNKLEWRFRQFPLWEYGVTTKDVHDYWDLTRQWEFPEVGNCDFCFWHTPYEQRIQYEQYPKKINWWVDKEKATGRTFISGKNYTEYLNENTEDGEDTDISCLCHD